MPPNPATGAGADCVTVVSGAGPGVGVAAGVTSGIFEFGVTFVTTGTAVVSVGVATPLVVEALLSFSCVRPYAVTPSTPPIATWNNPPPCRVIGTH